MIHSIATAIGFVLLLALAIVLTIGSIIGMISGYLLLESGSGIGLLLWATAMAGIFASGCLFSLLYPKL